jgi:hypothetical protein
LLFLANHLRHFKLRGKIIFGAKTIILLPPEGQIAQKINVHKNVDPLGSATFIGTVWIVPKISLNTFMSFDV